MRSFSCGNGGTETMRLTKFTLTILFFFFLFLWSLFLSFHSIVSFLVSPPTFPLDRSASMYHVNRVVYTSPFRTSRTLISSASPLAQPTSSLSLPPKELFRAQHQRLLYIASQTVASLAKLNKMFVYVESD